MNSFMNPDIYIQRYFDADYRGFNGCTLVINANTPRLYDRYMEGKHYSGKSHQDNPILEDILLHILLKDGGCGQWIPRQWVPIDRIISC